MAVLSVREGLRTAQPQPHDWRGESGHVTRARRAYSFGSTRSRDLRRTPPRGERADMAVKTHVLASFAATARPDRSGHHGAAHSSTRRSAPLRRVSWLLWGALLIGVVAAAACGDQVLALREQLRTMGAAGVIAFVLLEALWTMTTVPSAPLMTMAGMLYGFWLGAAYVLIGNLLGSAASFWLGRVLLRDRVQRWKLRYQELATALSLVESRPIASVFLGRVSSVFPLTLMGYALGTTSVSLTVYLFGVLLGVLPGAVLYPGIGRGLWHGLSRGVSGWGAALTGIALLAASVWFVYRRRHADPA